MKQKKYAETRMQELLSTYDHYNTKRGPSVSLRSFINNCGSPRGPSGNEHKSLVIIQAISTKQPVKMSPDCNLVTAHEREHREEVMLKNIELFYALE